MTQRTIKFRAWERKSGKMRHDFYVEFGGRIRDALGVLSAGDYPLMQFTGLHDKNGKEIWEGDIIERNFYKGGSDYRPTMRTFVQYRTDYKEIPGFYLCPADMLGNDDHENWNPGSFRGPSPYSLGKPMDWLEVIGNIYENPELLTP